MVITDNRKHGSANYKIRKKSKHSHKFAIADGIQTSEYSHRNKLIQMQILNMSMTLTVSTISVGSKYCSYVPLCACSIFHQCDQTHLEGKYSRLSYHRAIVDTVSGESERSSESDSESDSNSKGNSNSNSGWDKMRWDEMRLLKSGTVDYLKVIFNIDASKIEMNGKNLMIGENQKLETVKEKVEQ